MNRDNFLLLFCLIGVVRFAFGQGPTQTVRGVVLDAGSREPLPFANVYIPGTDMGSVTDDDGRFVISDVGVGRYDVRAGFVGYEPVIIKNVMVGSGKEVVLEILLEGSVTELEGVVVKPVINKDKPLNSMAAVSARTISVEESSRYAGTFDDPGRMASNFSGVASAGVAVNAVVVRGNAPKGVLWRIEGVDVPVPSHFAGSNVAGGGGLTMFSSRLLANSDFYTGAFPAEFSNATAGVFDMKLRNGNSRKNEFALQAGLHGVEASAEGPFSSGYDGSYLFNYRYSTLALIFPLLPEMENSDEVPVYQDLSFKVNLPAGRAGTFSIWGIGGLSDSKMRGTDDPDEWVYPESRAYMDFYYDMGVAGISHSKVFNSKTLLNNGIAFSGSSTGYNDATRLSSENPDEITDLFKVSSVSKKVDYYSRLNHVVNKKLRFRAGADVSVESFEIEGVSRNFISGSMEGTMNGSGRSYLLNAYMQSKYFFNEKISVVAGLNMSWFSLNGDTNLEPRFSASYEVSPRHMVSVGYGLHHQTEPLFAYYVKKSDAISGDDIYPNMNMEMMGAHHFVISYDFKIDDNLRFKAEPYLQLLYDVPVVDGTPWSMINYMSDWSFDEELVNAGEGSNYGLDLTLERFLNDGFYYLSTLSLYKSLYKGGDGVQRRSRFDGGYVFNLLGGKEFVVRGKNILGINLKYTLLGPYLFQPVDLGSTIMKQDIVYDSRGVFVRDSDDPSHMSDLTFSYRINGRRSASVFVVQLKNLLGSQYQGKKFNVIEQRVEDDYFRSIVPFLSYKLEF